MVDRFANGIEAARVCLAGFDAAAATASLAVSAVGVRGAVGVWRRAAAAVRCDSAAVGAHAGHSAER